MKVRNIKSSGKKSVGTRLPYVNMPLESRDSQMDIIKIGNFVKSKFGSFRIGEKISSGTCADVYSGTDVCTNEEVALKIFRPKFKDTVISEYKQILQLARHCSYVVSPYGWCLLHLNSVLILESLAGTVSDIMASHNGKYPSSWLMKTLSRDLLRGLQYIHSQGIVHADIKPSNIMWCARQELFKIIDFGLSFPQNSNTMQHAVQTKAYMAPETIKWNQFIHTFLSNQYKFEQSAISPSPEKFMFRPTSKIDIWSAGCILTKLFLTYSPISGNLDIEDLEICHNSLLKELDATERKYSKWRRRYPKHYFSRTIKFLKCFVQFEPDKRLNASKLLGDIYLEKLNDLSEWNVPFWDDLSVMPTKIIRIWDVFNSVISSSRKEEIRLKILELCNGYSTVIHQKVVEWSTHDGNELVAALYLQFDSCYKAEELFSILKSSEIDGRTLILSFYLKRHFDDEDWFAFFYADPFRFNNPLNGDNRSNISHKVTSY